MADLALWIMGFYWIITWVVIPIFVLLAIIAVIRGTEP